MYRYIYHTWIVWEKYAPDEPGGMHPVDLFLKIFLYVTKKQESERLERD